jgi:hypothetical protein
MTLFVDVPDDVVRQQDDVNMGKELATPNKVHVLVDKRDIIAAKEPDTIYALRAIRIQRDKKVYINFEVPMTSAAFTNLTNYVNIVVNVNDLGWWNLGNTNFRVPLSIYRLHTWHRFTTSMLYDFTALQAADSTQGCKLDFGLVFQTSASSTGTHINGNCDINATGKGGRGQRLDSVADQNYLRLIIEEVG